MHAGVIPTRFLFCSRSTDKQKTGTVRRVPLLLILGAQSLNPRLCLVSWTGQSGHKTRSYDGEQICSQILCLKLEYGPPVLYMDVVIKPLSSLYAYIFILTKNLIILQIMPRVYY